MFQFSADRGLHPVGPGSYREDEESGLAPLIEVGAGSGADVGGLLTAVMDAIRAWTGGAEQGDDITLVALSITG